MLYKKRFIILSNETICWCVDISELFTCAFKSLDVAAGVLLLYEPK